jgi:hypothetical protein
MMSRLMPRAIALTMAMGFLASGCASEKISQQEYAQPMQVMAAAEQAGAKEDSDAAIHMQYAEENLKKANELMDSEDYDDARHYLEMAKADAQLALALAEGKGMRAKVKELDKRIEKVKTDAL